MARDFRTMNMTAGQKIENDDVMKRLGTLEYRNMGTLAKTFLFNTGKALITEGIRVEPSSNMTVNITSGTGYQRLSSGDILPIIQIEDQTVTMEAATGVPRIDIIEAQIKNVTDKDDIVQDAAVVGGSIIITDTPIKRDIKYYLAVQKQTDTTTTTAATAGELVGTVEIPGTIDLSEKYLLRLADGEDGSFIEIDCMGATPEATTKAEIVSAINTAVGRTMASISGNYIVLTGEGTGETSYFVLKPPASDPNKDCADIVLGLSIGGSYKYIYQGTNEWFKIAEIDIEAATTVITDVLIRNIDEKDTWASESTDILVFELAYKNLSLREDFEKYINGSNWMSRSFPVSLSSNPLYAATYGNGLFVVGGYAGELFTSPDAINWTSRTSQFGVSDINGIAWGNNTFVAVGVGGKISTSTNGETWTAQTPVGIGNAVNDIIFADGIFILVGEYLDVDTYIMTSTDGITWTGQTYVPTSGIFYTIHFGNGLFIAGGGGGDLATSPDGSIWTSRTSQFGATPIMGGNYVNNKHVIVGESNKISTSSDGITWVLSTNPGTAQNLSSISGANGIFVAVSNYNIITSNDGENWIQQNPVVGFDGVSSLYPTLYKIIYQNKLFLAVGDRVMTSGIFNIY